MCYHQGKIRINAHFFEDGNVALKDVKNCEKSGIFKGENAILESQIMVDFIKEQESLIHASLQKMYGEMSQLFFKGMRRLLPSNYYNSFFMFVPSLVKLKKKEKIYLAKDLSDDLLLFWNRIFIVSGQKMDWAYNVHRVR